MTKARGMRGLEGLGKLSRADVEIVDELVDWQIANDRERTKRLPELFAYKLKRLCGSPLGFLRGAAPFFYAMLEARPNLALGPEGAGWIVGDAHLENFGAYRPDQTSIERGTSDSKKSRIARFDLNDFDESVVGPWRLDVLRLATSILLAGRELGTDGLVALDLCDELMGAWSRAAFDGEPPPPPPAPVRALVTQTANRSKQELLDGRTKLASGKRRFDRGPRYADLHPDVVARVAAAFDDYITNLESDDRPAKGTLEIVDCALRIAGTGSLGCVRVAILVKGKGGDDGGWIFDMKEASTPTPSLYCSMTRDPSPDDPAKRVAMAYRACIERPPRMMGTTKLRYHDEELPMLVRRLSPQEDKLNLRRLKREDLPELAAYLGALLGTAHARAVAGDGSPRSRKASARWSASDLATIRHHAITVAGLHEAMYLALCGRAREHLASKG